MVTLSTIFITVGCGITTVSALYLYFNYYRKTYPQFASLPGPFKYIGTSYHRIPNGVRFKIYYPSSKSQIEQSNCKKPKTYFTDKECIDVLIERASIPRFLFSALNKLEGTNCSIANYENAPINTNNNNKYPLLIFSHGVLGNFDIYSQICNGLASYGIIVAILEHTDESALYTKLPNGDGIKNKQGYHIDDNGNTYKPNPWTIEDDIKDFGNRRLKPIRVPEYIQFYNYLTKYTSTLNEHRDAFDDRLYKILSNADINNIICGGQSFGGVTSWLSYIKMRKMNDNQIKCLLLLDPWFGPIDIDELKDIKWNIPSFILTSEEWINNKKYLIKLTDIVVRNNEIDAHKNIWEYVNKFTHTDSSDVPLWGPSWFTKSRKLFTSQEWSDLLIKRSASFIAENIPSFKQQFTNNPDVFTYDKKYINPVNI